jgi:hypothetical protein
MEVMLDGDEASTGLFFHSLRDLARAQGLVRRKIVEP